ncbi:zinc finger (C3HC4-type RING finger) family protein [Raphanus sativus]|uniref:Uncharacterized protein LOC130496569 n=1 Tax=Raphanus sativus TaxID=3726 RepID=A0A9W3BZR0_RAPSA|nr:uncharacterized protein LOC130496569 [Raphanus sativus]KAJ4885830.1 zinc finger (C3HC4-type RING finger) family protein [Raphanus sativus]
MGKPEEDGNLRAGEEEAPGDSAERRRNARCGCGCFEWISGFVGCKCLFVVLLSVSLFLSALFLLLPFGGAVDRGDSSYLDPRFKGHAVVASFSLDRPKSFLSEHLAQLRNDIFQEMSYISINVTILALESHEPNMTKVVFGIDHDTAYGEILPMSLSAIKGMFESVLINQSPLQLTKPLFGETFLFEVLKFPGGITVIPPQSAFPLQKFKLSFNFTLNYSIQQIQINFNTLAIQLKNGLNLAPYENLYVTLSNSEGSTVSPPTTVHSSVLLRVGTSNPSPRLKQLTDTITGSRSKNLGLNNTIFGKVKQVRLSSFLPNSSDSSSKSPSPAPSPHSNHHHNHHHHHHNHHHHHHHNHHHHHHHHHLSPNMAPGISPVASPVPQRSPGTRRAPFAPPPCNSGNRRGQRVHFRDKHSHFSSTPTPTPSPSSTSHRSSPRDSAQPPHASYHPPHYSARPPHASHHSPRYSARPPPHHQLRSPAPIPAAKPHVVPVSAPLPHVVFAHQAKPPEAKPSEPQHANEAAHPQPQTSSSNLNLPAMPWIVLLMLIAAWLRE